MTHTKNVRTAAQRHSSNLSLSFKTVKSAFPDDTRESFFRFVDQNPLFRDNTKTAIRAMILSLHEKHHIFTSQEDEDEKWRRECFRP